MNPQPPKLARKLFDWYCGHAPVDDLAGDLEELFLLRVSQKGIFRAQLFYWKAVFSLLFSYAIRKRKKAGRLSHQPISFALWGNYLKVALRNLYQHKYFSLLNAFGLAIGMSVSLLLISMYSYVSTYDDFHEHREDIYSITTTRTEGIETFDFASAPLAVADKIKTEFGGAAEVIRVYNSFAGEVVFERENIPIRGYYVEPGFLETFTFPLLQGDPTALSRPNQIVLTESTARKLFNSTDVVGKQVALKDQGLFEISGVLRDYPKNTHFRFEALASFNTLPNQFISEAERWTHYQNQFVYVRLTPHVGPNLLQDYLVGLANRINKQSNIKVTYAVQPLDEIVTSETYNGIGPKWETSGFIVFAVIALLILLPACFNYTNISIARALKRSKEIGLRKTLGGLRQQIFFQFLTETVVITLAALVGALAIFLLIRSEFQSMMVEAATLNLGITLKTGLLFLVFAIFTGFLAGGLPALHFARLNPIQALRSKVSNSIFSALGIRKGLTIFQFALSFCFVLSLVVFGRQYNTLLHFDFGFKKDNLITVDLRNTNPELLRTEFSKLPGIQSVSLSSGSPALSSSRIWVHKPVGDSLEVTQLFIDENFIEDFNLKVLRGQVNLPAQKHERHVVVNEQFLVTAKIPTEDAIGKIVQVEGNELVIQGVVRNFHFAPPQVPIGSFIFRFNSDQFTQANLLVNSTDAFTLFSSLEKTWKELGDNLPLQAQFLDAALQDSFLVYRYLLKMAGFLGLIALSVSLLGLLGMVVYTSELRLKEVSVRKVLGADVWNIIYLLSKDYLKLLTWAILLGIALSIFIYQTVFTRIPDYQTHLTVWDVLIGCVLLLGLGLLTIATQTHKAAKTNPAEVLKME